MTVPEEIGIVVTTSIDIVWAEVGEHLAEDRTSIDQTNFIGAFSEVITRYPMQIAVLAERILLQEKDDPDMRATREAVQKFCRELLEHLDGGSR